MSAARSARELGESRWHHTGAVVTLAAALGSGAVACGDDSDDASSTSNVDSSPNTSADSANSGLAFSAAAGELVSFDVPDGLGSSILFLALEEERAWEFRYSLGPTTESYSASYERIDPRNIAYVDELVTGDVVEIWLPADLGPQRVKVCMEPEIGDRCVTGEVVPN